MNVVHNTEGVMFKTIITLKDGRIAAAVEQIADRKTLAILDQEVRKRLTRADDALASLRNRLAPLPAWSSTA